MNQSREESKRVWKEFARLYELKPELNVRANDQIILDCAEENGGSETFTVENVLLWLDDREFRSRLAVLKETPQQALDRFMADNSALDCEANRKMIEQRIRETRETVQQAVSALRNELAFNQEIANEQSAKKETEERAALIEEIAQDYSPFEHVKDIRRQKLQHRPIETLRADVQVIRDRKRFRQMSTEELKQHIRSQRGAQATPALPELPKYVERSDLVALLNATDVSSAAFPIELLDGRTFQSGKAAFKYLCEKYGFDEVNRRLGTYTEPPVIAGRVRHVLLEI